MSQLILFQLHDQIREATKKLSTQREGYKSTELCILNAEKASSRGLDQLLSKFKLQKRELQATRQHIASLSDTGIDVQIS